MKFKTKNIQSCRLNENGYKNQLYIEIIPYESELNLNKVARYIKTIYKNIEEDFVLYLESFCIDGLTETNKNLIYKNSILQCKYTDNYRTLKVEE